MGRYLRFLIMFGPMIYRFIKKMMASKNSQASNNRNLPQQQNGQYQQQRGQKDFDFKEGENPLG